MNGMIRGLALLLTVLTGFSGLVYEVTWQKYLATLLGSHSEATAAVLGIFLGGLSVGYWFFGAMTSRVVARAAAAGKAPRLLLLYGALEGSIGVYVLVFPWLFRWISAASYAIPHGSAGLGFVVDILLSVLLLGPPSVLMGGTIPILTQALARSLADATRFHAFVYAFNTVGAFAGALVAGFYLVPTFGFDRVMVAMGTINLFAGSTFVLVGLRGRAVVSLEREPDAAPEADPKAVKGMRSYAAVALLTGFAMMAMQTTVNRLGSLTLGSSQFTFSMVVAIFVLSIALGSFAVSSLSRIPKAIVVLNQWGIALLFVLLYPMLDESGYYLHIVRTLFRDTDPGFIGYHVMVFLLVLVSIGPPVVLSGAALPLLFHHLRTEVRHLGDLAGTLYSWNTLGSLLGALIGGYLLFFWLDLHEVYRVAVGALVVAAVVLTSKVYGPSRVVAGGASIALLATVALLPAWEPAHLYAGLFRKREAEPNLYVGATEFLTPRVGEYAPRIIFSTDDPTSSVVIRELARPGVSRIRSVATDGKSDGDTDGDYLTVGLLALLPALMADKAERAFVIGWGTGITAGELGALDSMQDVQIAEFSRGVLEAAPLFDFAALDASTNPKLHVIQSDAYRALMRAEGTYDVIVSQPSLAWSAGVENLYTREFLTAAKSRLSAGGVYAQFVHRYESDDAAIALMLRTFADVFDHVAVWQDPHRVLLLLGFENPRWATDHYRLEQQYGRKDLQAGLARSGIPSFAALLAHELLPLGVLHAADLPGPVHSIYHPRLNTMAARAFFRGSIGNVPFTGFGEAARIGRKNSLLAGYTQRFGGKLPDELRAEVILASCNALETSCKAQLARWYSEDRESVHLVKLLEALRLGRLKITREEIAAMSELFSDRFVPGRVTGLDEARKATANFVSSYHHAAPFGDAGLLAIWSSCVDAHRTAASCSEAAEQQGLVDGRAGEGRAFLEECMSKMGVGEGCRTGLVEARRLLEIGVDPAAR